MRRSLLTALVCPVCRGDLELRDTTGDEIQEGWLVCTCGRSFPILDGIPRLLPDVEFEPDDSSDDGHKQPQQEFTEFRRQWHRTQKSFGRQWLQYDVQTLDEDMHTFRVKTFFELESLKGLRVLDAGCGGGRYSYVVGKTGADVISVDISRAVEKTAELCREFPNVHIIQSNLMQLPVRTAWFDRIFSIGVLHHTPNTRAAFEALLPYLKPGGTIAIWVYPNWSQFREAMNKFWRSLTTRLPHWIVHALSVLGSPIGAVRGRVYRSRRRLLARLLWQTEKLLPGFSNHPDRRQRICDTFDWFTPQYQWHHTDDEVRSWFEAAGLTNIKNLSAAAAPFHEGLGQGVNFSGQRRVESQ